MKVKDTLSIISSKGRSGSSVKTAIIKATAVDDLPPKEKHVKSKKKKKCFKYFNLERKINSLLILPKKKLPSSCGKNFCK